MVEQVVLGLFDNPVFQSEIVFLVGAAIFGGVIGLLGRSETVAVFGVFLVFIHNATAVGSNVPQLNKALWVIGPVIALYMAFQLYTEVTGSNA